MENLTSIAEHSDWLDSKELYVGNKWKLHRNRVNFGKQPLEIWQFVPCKLIEGVWVILEEPVIDDYPFCDAGIALFREKEQEYQQAKERCLFEGFEFLKPSYFKSKELYIIVELKENVFEFKVLRDINKTDCSLSLIHTIEDLSKFKPLLTTTPQKQIKV